jgi:hypothetical protein
MTKDNKEVIALLIEKVGTVNTGDAGKVEGLTNMVEDFRFIEQ